jgi:hypothetical protein
MPTWLSCGKQRYYIDEEALFWELHGEVTATEIHGITDILVALHRQHGVALAVCDARNSSAITPEARKAISDRHTAGTAVAAPSVIFGGSVIQRTLLAPGHSRHPPAGRKASRDRFCRHRARSARVASAKAEASTTLTTRRSCKRRAVLRSAAKQTSALTGNALSCLVDVAYFITFCTPPFRKRSVTQTSSPALTSRPTASRSNVPPAPSGLTATPAPSCLCG